MQVRGRPCEAPPRPPETTVVMKSVPRRLPCAIRAAAVPLFLAAGCARPVAVEEPLLLEGARVRLRAPRVESPWRTALVGRAGPCVALMVPDSWSSPRRFEVVLVDSVAALRRSTRYDGRPGPEGTPRTYDMPSDTSGEQWTDLSMDRVLRRHGGCDPMQSPGPGGPAAMTTATHAP